MKIILQDGMKFRACKCGEEGFVLSKVGNTYIANFPSGLSCPIKGNIDLNDYMPLANIGSRVVWINEPNEYEE